MAILVSFLLFPMGYADGQLLLYMWKCFGKVQKDKYIASLFMWVRHCLRKPFDIFFLKHTHYSVPRRKYCESYMVKYIW